MPPPSIRLLDPPQHVEGENHGRAAAEEHRAPAIARAHGEIERAARKKPTYSRSGGTRRPSCAATRATPRPRTCPRPPIRRRCRAGEETEHAQPHTFSASAAAPVNTHSRQPPRRGAGPAEGVRDRAPHERAAPPGQEHGKEHGPGRCHVARRPVHARLGQQLAERRCEHQGENERVHAVERPADQAAQKPRTCAGLSGRAPQSSGTVQG